MVCPPTILVNASTNCQVVDPRSPTVNAPKPGSPLSTRGSVPSGTLAGKPSLAIQP